MFYQITRRGRLRMIMCSKGVSLFHHQLNGQCWVPRQKSGHFPYLYRNALIRSQRCFLTVCPHDQRIYPLTSKESSSAASRGKRNLIRRNGYTIVIHDNDLDM